ncbi:MAG: phosphatidate cytidylyltransferase [Planctomycetota bacterium]|nr:phosphatidate cytidylyltransferase [Planctomycetota bacterium]
MLGWRLFISAILIPALIGIFVLDHRAGESAPYLFSLSLFLIWRGAYEFADLLKTRSFTPSFLLIGSCSTLVVAASWGTHFVPTSGGSAVQSTLTGSDLTIVAFALSVLAAFLRGAIRYREPGSTMETLGADVLGIAYLGVLLSVTAQLRWVAGVQAGYLVLASLVIGAKCGDIGGYTLGRLFGKKKLVPTLSPGKTWMGAYGAVLGSSLAVTVWLHFAPGYFFTNGKPCPIIWSLIYGAVIGIVGLVGDLAESLIKRDVGRKDSAVLLPGFGGLLDLLDSVLYAGPVAVLLWKVLPLVTWPLS